MASNYNAIAVDAIQASADFAGNGAIEINRYENEIVDLVRRESIFMSRVDRRPATGQPHRYWEQMAIGTATASDPRNISPTPSGPARVERAAYIKCFTAQTNMSLFDIDVTRMQGQFAGLQAKDIEDIVNSIIVCEAPMIWTGNDTSLTSPTTLQYMGLLSQVNPQFVVAPGYSIIDALKAEVALMAANQTFKVKPTAIYLNPITLDLIDREAKSFHIELGTTNVAAGVTVKSIVTAVGELPLIPDPWLSIGNAGVAAYGFAAPAAGNRSHYAVIVTESMILMPSVTGEDGNVNPRIFQLGLLSNLAGQYVGVHFNTVIAKGYSYAHAVGQIQRP